MEEQVGQYWHRLITRLARSDYPEARITLDDVRKPVGMMFRALGGDGGLRVEAATTSDYETRRSLFQRIAGSHKQLELAWRDMETLRLPESLAIFPKKQLNRELYFWLAALAAKQDVTRGSWFMDNQQATKQLIKQYPGLFSRYKRLVAETIKLRPDIKKLPKQEAERERAVCQALSNPGCITELPEAKLELYPVWLWLHPFPPALKTSSYRNNKEMANPQGDSQSQTTRVNKKKKGKRTEDKKDKGGLLAFRLESLFTRAEHVKVDRTTDDEEDVSKAKDALEDIDKVSVAQADKKSAVTLSFDLDLPAPAQDDATLSGEILLPEWDWKHREMRPNYCQLQPLIAKNAEPRELPQSLRQSAKKLTNQFEALAPVRTWHRGQNDGSEIDLEAWLRHKTDTICGQGQTEAGLYRDFRGGTRELSCLLLADLSLSTDAWVNNSARIIDIIRDSLYLFSEALSHTGDRFALFGFSSRSREHVRFHHIKNFEQVYDNQVRGRIESIKPGFYTRMGAAIRQASSILNKEASRQRLLLLLTDGKPNDLDHYEGRYGIEDTRQAVIQARKEGLQVFCVTIDEKAEDYLPHLFGANHYVLIRKATDLPSELPLLYMRLTQDT